MTGMWPFTHGILAAAGRENRHYNAIVNLGLASSNLKLAIDVADSACFASSTAQRLTDLSTEATHIQLGNSTSANTDDPTFTGVSGASIEAIVLYVHTGTDSTSRLIMYQDTGVTGLPLTPDGSDVQITVDAAGWFVL